MLRQTPYFILFALLLFGKLAVSQDLRKEADSFYEHARFQEAMFLYSTYQQESPGDREVLLRLGICHYYLGNGEKALEYLQYLFGQDSKRPDPEIFYYLGRTHHGLHQFQDAVLFYKAYLRATSESNNRYKFVVENIKRCLSGLSTEQNPKVALVENLGSGVNTEFDEFAPLLSVNHDGRLYFSAAKPNSIGGRRSDDGHANDEKGSFRADMFFVDSDPSGWFYPQPLNDLLNTPREEVALGFSEDGKVLYYFRGYTLFAGDLWTDTAGTSDERLFAQRPFAGPISMRKGDTAPFFFKDSILIFASRREGGLGGLDLYHSIRQADGSWSEAKNMGPHINSPYDDTNPYLAPDGRTLYFSSNRVESVGGLDIFRCQYEDTKRAWSAVENIGFPINSAGDEAYFSLNKKGDKAYFSSDRLGGNGKRDIYMAYFKEEKAAEMQPSTPAFFATVANTPALLLTVDEQALIELDPIHYDKDEDLNSPKAIAAYRQMAGLARAYPHAQVTVTVHTDVSGPDKFDLYFGIKRAEIVGKALMEAGLSGKQIKLQSIGSAFPQAREVVDMEENPIGKSLNRRVELSLNSLFPLPVKVKMKPEVIHENMASPLGNVFLEKTDSLYFKAYVSTTQQLLNTDILAMFDNTTIESQAGTGDYHYSVGIFNNAKDAKAAVRELKAQGFGEANVEAYINHVPISRSEAKEWVKKYPALKEFLK